MKKTTFKNLTAHARLMYTATAALYTLIRSAQITGDPEKIAAVKKVDRLFFEYIYEDPFYELEDLRYYSSRKTGLVCDFILPVEARPHALSIARSALAELGGRIPNTAAHKCIELLSNF